MKKSFKISLKANEKIYINGAVLRFDRRTSVEFLNDVSFLLEGHIMQIEQAITPIQQLYYVIQIMLMAPNNIEMSLKVYNQQIAKIKSFAGIDLKNVDLQLIDGLVNNKKYYEAMKLLRQSSDVMYKKQDEDKLFDNINAGEHSIVYS